MGQKMTRRARCEGVRMNPTKAAARDFRLGEASLYGTFW